MPPTDLSNTKWLFNESPSTYPETSTRYNPLNFSASNGNIYTSIRFNPLVGIFFGSTQVYDVSTDEWIDEAYRTIEISGGTAATNADLIALMQANAVQQMPDISVVYKGSTIAKMSSSGTKTLLTSGKYCEDNITIEYTKSGGGVSSIPLAMRPDAELVQRWSDDYLIHADKNITIPAYTTAATTVVSSSDLTPIAKIDRNNYDYLVIIRCLAYPIYDDTTAVKGRVEYFLAMNHYECMCIPGGLITPINGDSVTYSSNSYVLYAQQAKYRMVYWSSASAVSTVASASYGVYQSITAPTMGSTTITAKTPTVVVRGSTTYFTQTAWEMMTDIREQYTIDLYRAPKYALNQNGFLEQSAIFSLINSAQSASHTLT